MRVLLSQRIRDCFAARDGSAIIAVGLAVLTAAMLWPAVPMVSAMALIALGATNAVLARFRGAPGKGVLMLAHAITYGGLYAVFLGATLDASKLDALTAIDLAVSAVPMSVALVRTCRVLPGELAPD